jgi:hypothetical protein
MIQMLKDTIRKRAEVKDLDIVEKDPDRKWAR